MADLRISVKWSQLFGHSVYETKDTERKGRLEMVEDADLEALLNINSLSNSKDSTTNTGLVIMYPVPSSSKSTYNDDEVVEHMQMSSTSRNYNQKVYAARNWKLSTARKDYQDLQSIHENL
ncbi:hypothetical protein TNCV_2326991 [Trichonephila clavipes]|nr:hypothetical protein TNCV_2326991 [Trichonephila clavipes]